MPTCAQGLSVSVMGNSGNDIFGAFWLLLCVLRAWGLLVLLVHLFAHKTWVTLVCLPLGTSFWRITFVTTGGNVRQLIKSPAFIFGFMIISSMGSHIC